MHGQCDHWNEFTNKCELRKYSDAIGLKPTFYIEEPPEEHIKNYCKTKDPKNCWKIEAMNQIIDDSIFDEDFPEYMSVKQVLRKWLKWTVRISIVGIIIIAMIILTMYFTSGSFH